MPTGEDDRELQDRIIRYLTDPSNRTEAFDIGLSKREAEKAQRFSKFLTRRYYRDRLARAFRYSRMIIWSLQEQESSKTTLLPEDVVDSPDFDEFLAHSVLGSLTSARTAGALALAQMNPLAIAAWWEDLLRYEFAFFVQLATSEISPATALPSLAANTIVQTFEWAMPEVIGHLKSGAPVAEDLRDEVSLLFSRTHHGRIYVVELDESARALVSAINGARDQEELATVANASLQQTRSLLATLLEIGAVTSGNA